MSFAFVLTLLPAAYCPTATSQSGEHLKVRATLRLAVDRQSVRLGAKHFETTIRDFFGRDFYFPSALIA